jgi:hypothetical protein
LLAVTIELRHRLRQGRFLKLKVSFSPTESPLDLWDTYALDYDLAQVSRRLASRLQLSCIIAGMAGVTLYPDSSLFHQNFNVVCITLYRECRAHHGNALVGHLHDQGARRIFGYLKQRLTSIESDKSLMGFQGHLNLCV